MNYAELLRELHGMASLQLGEEVEIFDSNTNKQYKVEKILYTPGYPILIVNTNKPWGIG